MMLMIGEIDQRFQIMMLMIEIPLKEHIQLNKNHIHFHIENSESLTEKILHFVCVVICLVLTEVHDVVFGIDGS